MSDEKTTEATGVNPPPKRSAAHIAATIAGIVVCIPLVLVLIVNLTILVKNVSGQGKIASVGGVTPFIVLTDSMNPTIESGDLVVCRETDADSVREGDIIAFFDPEGSGSSVVTHRVAAIDRDAAGKLSFTTKGDANNTEDAAAVPAENLIGTYWFRAPGVGNVALFLQSPQGVLVCVAVPVALLLIYDAFRRRANDKKTRAETTALQAEIARLKAEQAGKTKGVIDGDVDASSADAHGRTDGDASG